jgi:tetratricopeptide (TPR) repeat protein
MPFSEDMNLSSPHASSFYEALVSLVQNPTVNLHQVNVTALSPMRRLPQEELKLLHTDLQNALKSSFIQASVFRTWIVEFGIAYISVDTPDSELLIQLNRLLEIMEQLNYQKTKLAALLYNNIALKYHHMQMMDKAIIFYTKAIDIDNQYSLVYYNRAICYKALSLYSQAVQDYTKAFELDPADSDSLNNRGSIYYQDQKYDSAILDFTRSIELQPTSPFPLYNRSLCYGELGNYVLSVSDLRRAHQNHTNQYWKKHQSTLEYLLAKSDDPLFHK